MFGSPRLAVIAFTCFIFASPNLSAQDSLETELRTLLVDKTVTLRHFYEESKQTYDSSGRPTFKPKECSWTACSMLQVAGIEIKKDVVEIKARRIFATFPDGKLKNVKTSEKLSITVELTQEPNRKAALRSALLAILLGSDEKISSIVPEFWRDYLAGEYLAPPDKKFQDIPYSEGIAYKVGTDVTPPKAQSTPDPAFTGEAKKYNVQGTALFRCVVGVDGKLHDLRIVRPLGYGLDERSAEVLKRWRFSPGQKGGAPVPIAVNIEVNFHLY